jgi:hypothetical protein
MLSWLLKLLIHENPHEVNPTHYRRGIPSQVGTGQSQDHQKRKDLPQQQGECGQERELALNGELGAGGYLLQ